ncbi:hypothetical protein DERP_007143, partial [Dermatophagoides pteronyssinus]
IIKFSYDHDNLVTICQMIDGETWFIFGKKKIPVILSFPTTIFANNISILLFSNQD